jgi:hypothetical protein
MQPARRACICACECNQLAAPVSAHANATSSPRLYLRMQMPVSAHANATSLPRLYLRMQMQPARRARRTCRASPSHTSHLQLCTRFAVLCAGFVLFVVLTFPKFNLYTLRIAYLSCVRSSVGTELGNQALCHGFDSGRKFSDFFHFRHFLQS